MIPTVFIGTCTTICQTETSLFMLAALPNLKLHVFGHIHEGYGVTHQEGLAFVNASICDRKYIPCHKPIVIELEEKR